MRTQQPHQLNQTRKGVKATLATHTVKFLRMFMVFALVFGTSLHLEYQIAFADELPIENSITELKVDAPGGYDITELGATLSFGVTAVWQDTEGKEHKSDISEYIDWNCPGSDITSINIGGGRLEVTATGYGLIEIPAYYPIISTETSSPREWINAEAFEKNKDSFEGPLTIHINIPEPEPTTYQVSFDVNGGDGSYEAITIEDQGIITLPDGLELTAPEGKSFAGWATDPEASEGVLSAGQEYMVGSDIVFYAQWREAGSGDDNKDESYAYVETVVILQNNETEFPTSAREGTAFSLENESPYQFRAAVTLVPDSLNPDQKDTQIFSSNAELIAYAEENNLRLDNPERALEWTFETAGTAPTQDEATETQGIESNEDNTDENTAGEIVADEYAATGTGTINESGVLNIEGSLTGKVSCSSYSAERDADSKPGYTSDTILITNTQQQSEGPQIIYMPNGGTGTMEPTLGDKDGKAIVASCSFTPPSSTNTETDTEQEATKTPEGEEAQGSDSTDEEEATTSPRADEESPSNSSTAMQTKSYAFKTWNTKEDGTGTEYKPGDEIQITEDLTLYAQWVETDEGIGKYSISYNANKGSGTMEPTRSNKENIAQVAPCTFSAPTSGTIQGEGSTNTSDAEVQAPNSNAAPLIFKGWGLSEDGTTKLEGTDKTLIQPGEKIELKKDLTLYAQWGQGAPAPPVGDLTVKISTAQVTKGQTQTLTAVVSTASLDETEFGFFWELSRDGGASWVELDGINEPEIRMNAQKIFIPVTDTFIGSAARVTVYVDTYEDGKPIQKKAQSEPVTITPAIGPSMVLNYEAKEYGESATLSLTASTDLNGPFDWYVWKKTSSHWEKISGVDGMTYTITVDENTLGSFYQVWTPNPAYKQDTNANDTQTQEGEETGPSTAPEETNAEEMTQGPWLFSNIEQIVAIVPGRSIIPGQPGGTQEGESAGDDTGYEPDGYENSDNLPIGPDDPNETTTPYEQPTPPTQFTDPTSGEEVTPEELDTQIAETGQGSIIKDDGTMAQVTPIDNIVSPDTYGPEVVPVNTIIADNKVAREITGSETASVEQEITTKPGKKWSAISVLPNQKEIQQVLRGNPFAPYVIPFVLAFMAAGMIERFFAYRQQKRPSSASFAN